MYLKLDANHPYLALKFDPRGAHQRNGESIESPAIIFCNNVISIKYATFLNGNGMKWLHVDQQMRL